jgi:hypothetical protein
MQEFIANRCYKIGHVNAPLIMTNITSKIGFQRFPCIEGGWIHLLLERQLYDKQSAAIWNSQVLIKN